MYLPRPLLSTLYTHLTTTHTPTTPPLLILTALTVDALCAVRILTTLLKRDFIAHTVVPVSGYQDLQSAGERLVQPLLRQKGGDGGRVVCMGCGGGVDLSEILLGLEEEEGVIAEGHGVEVWVVDAHRPWNLENVFGSVVGGQDGRVRDVQQGKILEHYRSGRGGVIVWDDGDVDAELEAEKDAFFALRSMPEITEDDLVGGDAESEDDDESAGGTVEEDGELSSSQGKRKRASEMDDDDNDTTSQSSRPRQRRRSNTSTPIPSSPGGNPRSNQQATSSLASPENMEVPSSPPSAGAFTLKQQKKDLLKLRRRYEGVLESYYDAGTHLSEPVASMLYSLASDLGREDNEVLWLAIVGIESVVLSPFFSSQSTRQTSAGRKAAPDRFSLVKHLLRDEVRRLNPPALNSRSQNVTDADTIPIHARSPTDTSIRLSPEPRFLLIRHWSLYDSMLHSPYLATRLHVWNEQGRKRLHKLLAKMGISLSEARKGYLHLDVEVKRSLNARLGKFAEQYGLEGLIPSGDDGAGFVRSWGWRGTLSAVDVATVVSAILEVGAGGGSHDLGRFDSRPGEQRYGQRLHHGSNLPSPPASSPSEDDQAAHEAPDWTTTRFFAAYDALSPTTHTSTHSTTASGLPALLSHLPVAQNLARAILRTAAALLSKHQIRHLRSFRLAVVREGPDVALFTHPGALVKLASWVGEAVAVLEAEKGIKAKKGESEALVLAALEEGRGVYVVVGLGGGSSAGRGKVSKAEAKAKEEKRKRRVAEKAARAAEKARAQVEKKRLRRERLAANGDVDSSDEDEGEESDGTESSASSQSSTSSDGDTDAEDDASAKRRRGPARNRFGQAFQQVVAETGARVRIDSFEHSVVEVKKEDLAGFLEGLSGRAVVG